MEMKSKQLHAARVATETGFTKVCRMNAEDM